jgi:pimeloyl-ACP methyl ester carboxylesterase
MSRIRSSVNVVPSVASLSSPTPPPWASAMAQGLEDFVLVGHSAGALIAAHFAAANPQRVRALGLIDAPPAPGAVAPEQVREILAALAHDPYGTVEKFWEQAAFRDSRPEVRDKLLAALRRLSRNAVIKGTGHWIQLDKPAEFALVLDIFLRAL